MITETGDWFAERTTGAPDALRARAAAFFAERDDGDLCRRLSRAGDAALAAAVREGAGREAALDLLAADALITLALLAAAEQDPAALGPAAADLRMAAAGTA